MVVVDVVDVGGGVGELGVPLGWELSEGLGRRIRSWIGYSIVRSDADSATGATAGSDAWSLWEKALAVVNYCLFFYFYFVVVVGV